MSFAPFEFCALRKQKRGYDGSENVAVAGSGACRLDAARGICHADTDAFLKGSARGSEKANGPCIVPSPLRGDDCMDAGGRAMQGAIAEGWGEELGWPQAFNKQSLRWHG